MKKIIRTTLSLFMMLILSACALWGTPTNTITGDAPPLRLTVQTRNGASTFNAAGDVIDYNYVVTNNGATPLAGPALVTDAPRQVNCPGVETVGNLNAYLDLNETITCTASYSITETDINTGSLTNLAIANVGGVNSNQSGVTLTRTSTQPISALNLTKTASSQTYSQLGQTITYNYTITNIGTTPLGPAQFVVNDNRLTAPLNCGLPDTTIAPSQPLTCSAPYLITQADLGAANVTNSATASGAGQTSAPATTTITNLSVAAVTQTALALQTATLAPSPSNLSPGSTIQHQVAVGEWLIQIGRCYGAAFDDIRNANPQIADPDFILPSMIVTVPRIGSAGRIYGPPCITFHTVQSGDTFESIAQRYNADLTVLRKVNPVTLAAGTVIKIPLNSAGSLSVTAVPAATATVTSTPAVTAQRLTLDPGQTTVSRIGIINPNETIQYVLAATAGQTLSIKLTAPVNEVSLGVNGPTGIALKTPDPTYTWSTTVTTAGDHYINIASVLGGSSKSYTLEVTLTGPAPAATATFTPTATSTPGGVTLK
jgi:uncharacterized repeat protein (TIGR01451 family)